MNPARPQTNPSNLALQEPPPAGDLADELSRNLEALAEVDADLAEKLTALRLTDHFIPAVGRDGAHTLQRKQPDGKTSWLGRTSMPTVSGPALLENFEHRGGNIAFHGIGQGLELALLTQRMEPCQTLFALEPDPLAVAGVLALHDLSEAIRSRQVVLLAGGDTFDRLLRFLLDNPGFDPPERFLQWPWQPQVDIDRFKSALEDLHRVLAERRRGPTDELLSKIQRLAAVSRQADISRCLVVTRRGDPTAVAMTGDLVAAGRSMGWSISDVNWHRPGQTSALALLEGIDRVGPHFILLLNELRASVGQCLPPAIPVVSWFLDPWHATQPGSTQLGPRDLVLAESPTTATRLLEAGISPETIAILPPGAGETAAKALPQPTNARGRDWDVACFADAVDLSPEARGIELSALAAVWKASVETLAGRAEQADAMTLERILDHVAKRAGARMTDPQVRKDLVERLEFDAAETILARHYLKALVDAGIRVRLWGRGWEHDSSLAGIWSGGRPDPRDLPDILAHSPLVMDCCVRERLGPLVLSAALAGAVPLVRGRFSPASGPAKGRLGWPKHYCPDRIGLPTYIPADQLLKFVRQCIRDPSQRGRLADDLRTRVLAEHLATHRLGAIALLVAQRTAG